MNLSSLLSKSLSQNSGSGAISGGGRGSPRASSSHGSDSLVVSSLGRFTSQVKHLVDADPAQARDVLMRLASELRAGANQLGSAKGEALVEVAQRIEAVAQRGDVSALGERAPTSAPRKASNSTAPKPHTDAPTLPPGATPTASRGEKAAPQRAEPADAGAFLGQLTAPEPAPPGIRESALAPPTLPPAEDETAQQAQGVLLTGAIGSTEESNGFFLSDAVATEPVSEDITPEPLLSGVMLSGVLLSGESEGESTAGATNGSNNARSADSVRAIAGYAKYDVGSTGKQDVESLFSGLSASLEELVGGVGEL